MDAKEQNLLKICGWLTDFFRKLRCSSIILVKFLDHNFNERVDSVE